MEDFSTNREASERRTAMTDNVETQELKDRLSLIENMLAEGRQTTSSWGWSFVLWGVAYFIAIAWSALGHAYIAWPVTMIGTSILTAVIASRMVARQPGTTIGRAIRAIWIGVGCSMFILLLSAGVSNRMDQQAFIAVVAAMLGSANAASGILLKWKAQFISALVWWAATVVSCFGTEFQSEIAGGIALFLCQIVFGIYMMVSEARERKSQNENAGRLHA
jgi:hypothetical protein